MPPRILQGSFIALAVFALIAIYAMRAKPDNGTPAAPPADPYKYLSWRPAPVGLPDQAFTGPDGAPVRLSDFKGKVLVVNLWASWCTPCVEEMPALLRLEKDLAGPGLAVIAIDIDHEPDKGRAWLAANGLSALPYYSDPGGKLFDALKAPGLPTTLFVNKAGQEAGRIAGAVPWDEPKARALVARAGG
jgi:thiol-disulfide isomerase/thioredoxin